MQHLQKKRHKLRQLIQGDVDEFLINAYVALLGAFPDEGGYYHYHAIASRGVEGRIDCLRDILSSDQARAYGARLELDVPFEELTESDIAPDANFSQFSSRLRTGQMVFEISRLRSDFHYFTSEGFAKTFAEGLSVLTETSQLESRLNDLATSVKALNRLFSMFAGGVDELDRPSRKADSEQFRKQIEQAQEDLVVRLEEQKRQLVEYAFSLYGLVSGELERTLEDDKT
ncbi:MAG TPA: hypothetical protein VK446_00565 [Methylocystis sp.]|nr:hypothetical protein [Methylocystis sp.]